MTEREMMEKILDRVSISLIRSKNYIEANVDVDEWISITFDDEGKVLTIETL